MNQHVKLDSVLEKIISNWDIPGLSIGIVENGKIVHTRSMGVQSLDSNIPVTPDSIFCLASIAKCFVASAVMQLVEKGMLRLDVPIVEYLPEFQLDSENIQKITLRQMLSHTAGIPDMDEAEYDQLVSHPEFDEDAPARFVKSLNTRKMVGLPGERFAYSNIAYDVLGYLITKVSGATFEEFMKKHVLEQSGMYNSTFSFQDVPINQLAVPHIRNPKISVNPILPYHRADAPASFLYSTVMDMCQWILTSLNQGRNNGKQILSPASYDLMWSPVAHRGYPPFREEMGLGWALGRFEGVRTIAHGGGGFGWSCHLILLPEKKSGTIILVNEESSAIESLEQAVVRTMLGLEPQAGPTSWMIPISHALHSGGINATYAIYQELLDRPEYFFRPYDMVTLFYQLFSVGKTDLAKEVLKLNLLVFPDNQYTKTLLTRHFPH
jgi:CubicO group peptidase (beta-lactamase class C family)